MALPRPVIGQPPATRWRRDHRAAKTAAELAGTDRASTAGAAVVGRVIAERARSAGVSKVAFDRGGYLYHGNIKALADAARENGLEF